MKTYSYILFFAVVLLLQVLLLNGMVVSPYVAPLIYIACIAAMPLDTSQIVMLAAGTALGVLMDTAMGVCGLNIIATLPLAFYRRQILRMVAGIPDVAREEGVPTTLRLGQVRFAQYLAVMVSAHGVIFFLFESFSFDNAGFLAVRMLCSITVTFVLVYILAQIFAPKFARR